MIPSSWQWQGAGQAVDAGPGWGAPPAHGEAHSAAHSHSARSPGGLGILGPEHLADRPEDGRALRGGGGRCLPLGPAAGPAGCAVGGDRPAGSVGWRRRRQRGDRAVREGQALLSDLRYSVSQAGLGKGGRHRRRRSQGNFLRCGSLPFPPSFRAGRNFIQERKKKKKGKETLRE